MSYVPHLLVYNTSSGLMCLTVVRSLSIVMSLSVMSLSVEYLEHICALLHSALCMTRYKA